MSFESLVLDTGSLGSKSAVVTNVPEPIKKIVAEAWKVAEEHPDRFFHVKLNSKQERDDFHLYGKAAAKQHKPELDYRKLPRPAEKDETIAYFTLRKVTPDMKRPGRVPQAKDADTGNSDDTGNSGKSDDKPAA